MTTKESIEYIKEQSKKHKSLVHASNILAKLKGKDAGKIAAIENLAVEYATYLKAQLEDITTWDKPAIEKRVALLNDYYDFYDKSPYDYNNNFTSQGKLRPTILEEFLFILFFHYINKLKEKQDSNDVIGSGLAKAYTNLYFSPLDISRFIASPSIKINVKDQDFAIYRKVGFQVKENNLYEEEIKVPMLAAEVKTYLDKTMLEGIIATAEKLKMGNPYARSIVVTETYEVDLTVDPSYSQIDQIYVIRGGNRENRTSPIKANVVQAIFDETVKHIESPWSDVETKLKKEGKVI